MTIVYKQHHGEGVPRVSRPQSNSSPSERMLIQSTLPAASLVGGQTPSARACLPASSNLAPQLQLLSLLSASSTFTNFSIEETPQAGPDTVFLILLGASRPQPREHPDSRSGWRWRSWPRSSLREGGAGRKCRLGLGVGGAVPVQGLRPGVCRAPGRRLPATEGLQRSGDRETPQIVPGPKCQQRGVPTGGFRDALCTGPPPPPPSSTLGSLGWDQAFGDQSAAALEPALQAVNQIRGGWGWG